jgi:chemotaxis signal transduction protein
MRFFICAVDEIILALPVDFVARIISVSRSGNVLAESDGGDVYLSLPLVFKKGEIPVHHGIVLKHGELLTAFKQKPPAGVILSTPRIETDMDIPDGDIRSLPTFMGQSDMLPYLSGAVFTGTTMILIVDIELLLKKISAMIQGGTIKKTRSAQS